MFESSPSKEFFQSINSVWENSAIAQSQLPQQSQSPVTNTAPPPSDTTTAIVLSVISAVGVVGMAASQIITKIGSNVIDNRKAKIQHELEQESAISDGFVAQSSKGFEVLLRLLDTAMSNIMQTSREYKEIFYLGHDEIKKNSERMDRLEAAVKENEKTLATVLGYQRDIMNVLKMRERGTNESHPRD